MSAGSAVVPGFELAGLAAFLRAEVDGFSEAPLDIELLAGGRSNLTARVSQGARSVVVRRPPLSHVLETAHDMAREYRVMSALGSSPVPVPQTLAFCDDVRVIGAPFQVLSFIDGLSIGDVPAAGALSEGQRDAASRGFVETLAALHSLDPGDVGLADFGRAEGYLERQVRRWRRQWDTSKTRELPIIDSLGSTLARSVPARSGTAIVHGDFRLDNVLLDHGRPDRALAVVDWEMSTLGDPLADLALTLLYWQEAGDVRRDLISVARGVTALPGFWTRTEVVSEYSRLTGTSIEPLEFYLGLACFKFAVILEGIHARHLAGGTVGDGFDGLDVAVPALAELGTVALYDGLSAMGT